MAVTWCSWFERNCKLFKGMSLPEEALMLRVLSPLPYGFRLLFFCNFLMFFISFLGNLLCTGMFAPFLTYR